MRLTVLSLIASLALPGAAGAGPLLAATLSLGLPDGGPPLTLASSLVTGSLVGGTFRLDAGVGLAGQVTSYALPFRRVLVLGANGALSGALGQGTFSPTAGLAFDARLVLSGGAPPLTLFRAAWPLGEPVEYAHVVFPTPSGLARPATHGGSTAGFRGDRWHLGRITQGQLTRSGVPLPDAATTGSVSATPGGNVHINLVSLSRVFGNDSFNAYRLPLAARLELVFAPEPAAPLLLGTAGAACAIAGAWRRRAR